MTTRGPHRDLEQTGGLDVLITNAAVQGQGFLEYLDDETFKRVFERNFFGLVQTRRAALPLLRKSPKARDQSLQAGWNCRLLCWDGVLVKQMGSRGLI